MKTFKPPTDVPATGHFLFLGGTIEMGQSTDWQAQVEQELTTTDWTVLNPRRDQWEPTWKQDPTFDLFREQVEWELKALERADRVLMYFDPSSKSPISLLELGLFARSGKLLVVCPQGFWRKGNIDIVCERYGIERTDSLASACELLRKEGVS